MTNWLILGQSVTGLPLVDGTAAAIQWEAITTTDISQTLWSRMFCTFQNINDTRLGSTIATAIAFAQSKTTDGTSYSKHLS